MDELLAYINAMRPDERVEFCRRAGTTVGYVRKAVSVRQRVSAEMAMRIHLASEGKISVDLLRPDIDWSYFCQQHCAQEA